MTLSEFKAWFEGYTEGLDGAPTGKQFERIKAKVAEISGAPITQTVFIDRYRNYFQQPMRDWSYPYVSYSAGTVGQGVGAIWMNGYGPEAGRLSAGKDQTIEASWDSHAAMYAVGKADAISNAA